MVVKKVVSSSDLCQLQVFSVHALLNGYDVISINPTGSGKTAIIYIFALALPKMIGIANTMVVVGRSSHQFKEQWFNTGMPLTMLIQQQLENPFGCPVLTMSMKAHMTGSSEEVAELSSSGAPLTVAEATSGKYRILFMQPEASVTDSGQRLLRELSRMDVIRGLVVDEVHQVHRRRSIKLIGICSELRNRDQYPQ